MNALLEEVGLKRTFACNAFWQGPVSPLLVLEGTAADGR